MIQFYLMHAVHRKVDTLQESLRSFHAAGIERITLLPDNGTLGPTGNTDRAMRMFVADPGNNTHMCVLQDDMVLARDTLSVLNIHDMSGGNCFALFTPQNNVDEAHAERSGWVPLSPSWNSWGGMVVMPLGVVQKVLDHPFWRRHVATTVDRRRADAALYETLRLMRVDCLHHIPSLADHIGQDASTIGNEHQESSRGYRFTDWG